MRIFRLLMIGWIGFFLPHDIFGVEENRVWEEFHLKKYNEKVKIDLKGEVGDYFSLTQEEPLLVKMKGPRKMAVHIRNCFSGEDHSLAAYQINVLQDERNFDEYAFSSKPSTGAKLLEGPQGTRVGKLKKLVIDIPDGPHTLKFFLPDSMTQQKFYLRFYMSELIMRKENRIVMSPEQYADIVELFFKERSSTYYRMTFEKPVELIVIGPTELKVVSRLEFNRRMKGKSSYQIRIFEDDQLIQTRQYRTYKSDAASYKQVSRLTPGRSRSFLLSVPKGKHRYRLLPVTLQKESVITKIMIPKKDIGIMEE